MFMLEIKICIKNIGVQYSLEKNETATMFFLKKPFLVYSTYSLYGAYKKMEKNHCHVVTLTLVGP